MLRLTPLRDGGRRSVERHLFEADGETIRDDIAEICIAIDDALSPRRGPRSGKVWRVGCGDLRDIENEPPMKIFTMAVDAAERVKASQTIGCRRPRPV